MQPYFFPYLGYFQLLGVADTFVFYDDVQFIQRGYIHRNRTEQGAFTIPLAAAGQDTLIRDRLVARGQYAAFKRKWLRGLRHTYGKAPHYATIAGLLEEVLSSPTASVSDLACTSVRAVADLLELPVRFVTASTLDYDRTLTGQARMLNLLTTLGATDYLNPAGGRGLYDPTRFVAAGIGLHFLEPLLEDVPCHGPATHSIVHLLAHHPPGLVRKWLTEHRSILTPQHNES